MAAYLPKLARQDLLDFYRQHYGPNNTIIAVVGDVKEKEIIALLNGYFKDWKRAEQPVQPSPAPPKVDRTTVLKLEKISRRQISSWAASGSAVRTRTITPFRS